MAARPTRPPRQRTLVARRAPSKGWHASNRLGEPSCGAWVVPATRRRLSGATAGCPRGPPGIPVGGLPAGPARGRRRGAWPKHYYHHPDPFYDVLARLRLPNPDDIYVGGAAAARESVQGARGRICLCSGASGKEGLCSLLLSQLHATLVGRKKRVVQRTSAERFPRAYVLRISFAGFRSQYRYAVACFGSPGVHCKADHERIFKRYAGCSHPYGKYTDLLAESAQIMQ